MGQKRSASKAEIEEEPVHSNDEDEDEGIQETPKVSSRGLKKKAPSLSQSSTSGVSGTSSPIKQIRFAAIQQTGFTPCPFEENIDRLPPSLVDLRQQLVDIGYGVSLIPQTLQKELKTVPSFAFFNTAEKTSKWRVPTPALAQGIVRSATKCQSQHHDESSWNMEVHRRVLDFAFRDSGDVFVGDYRYCTGAQIIQEYKPLGAPSKCVDFCLCIKPPQSSIEHKTIRNLISTRPGLSINQTDWGDLCTNPIALSIETKRQDDWNKALLQVGTWHSAQWRALPSTLHAIEFLTGIIVRGHSWYFLASTLEDGKSVLYHEESIGGTKNIFEVYKLLMALQCLGSWTKEKYWPAFRSDVLKLPAIEQQIQSEQDIEIL
ncbi:hypothetical protein HG530_014525 [Fusarium avenaceum]|nr:hypothetical protein HG530_014525 [Fusarium avenaceum]